MLGSCFLESFIEFHSVVSEENLLYTDNPCVVSSDCKQQLNSLHKKAAITHFEILISVVELLISLRCFRVINKCINDINQNDILVLKINC